MKFINQNIIKIKKCRNFDFLKTIFSFLLTKNQTWWNIYRTLRASFFTSAVPVITFFFIIPISIAKWTWNTQKNNRLLNCSFMVNFGEMRNFFLLLNYLLLVFSSCWSSHVLGPKKPSSSSPYESMDLRAFSHYIFSLWSDAHNVHRWF